jgi:hypothetical protein
MRKYFPVLFFLFLSLSSLAQQQAKDVLMRSMIALSGVVNGSYGIDLTIKNFSDRDTTSISARCVFEKTRTGDSTVLKYDLQNNRFERIVVNGQFRFYTIEKDNSAEVADLNKYNELLFLSGNINSNLLYPPLLFRKNFITDALRDSSIKSVLAADEKVNNEKCFVIKSSCPSDAKTKNEYKLIYISKSSFIPVRCISYSEQQGKIEYKDLTINNVLVNNSTSKVQFTRDSIPKSFHIISFEKKKK